MKKQLHYTACGLDNVWLENGFTFKSSALGEVVSVQDADGLHHLLAMTLVEKPGLLTGKEFRFLGAKVIVVKHIEVAQAVHGSQLACVGVVQQSKALQHASKHLGEGAGHVFAVNPEHMDIPALLQKVLKAALSQCGR